MRKPRSASARASMVPVAEPPIRKVTGSTVMVRTGRITGAASA
ncbi:hypothetical protein [Azospirillum brasilense]|nr:hypothetical protein [Azospirillum brasilense]